MLRNKKAGGERAKLNLKNLLMLRVRNDIEDSFFAKDITNNPAAKQMKYFLDPRLFVIIAKKVWFELDEFLKDHKEMKTLFENLIGEIKVDDIEKTLDKESVLTSFLKTCE